MHVLLKLPLLEYEIPHKRNMSKYSVSFKCSLISSRNLFLLFRRFSVILNILFKCCQATDLTFHLTFLFRPKTISIIRFYLRAVIFQSLYSYIKTDNLAISMSRKLLEIFVYVFNSHILYYIFVYYFCDRIPNYSYKYLIINIMIYKNLIEPT